MAEYFLNQKNWNNDRINPDQYLDMSIKVIISLPTDIMQKEPNFDIDKFLRLKFILTEQLETIAVGLKKIKPVRRDYDPELLTENQKSLRLFLIEFFKREYPEMGSTACSRTDSVMRFITEGAYSTRIQMMEEKVKENIKSGLIDKEIGQAQLANYKLQLIITAVQQTKVKALDIET